MWSIGCILGELLLGKPIFPGTSTLNQLARIMELTGRPSKEDIECMHSSLAQTMLDSLPAQKARSFKEFFSNQEEDAVDMLQNLLKFNPDKRIGVEDALNHRYVTRFQQSSTENILCTEPIKINMDDNVKFSVQEYRNQLYTQIQKRRKEMSRRRKKR